VKYPERFNNAPELKYVQPDLSVPLLVIRSVDPLPMKNWLNWPMIVERSPVTVTMAPFSMTGMLLVCGYPGAWPVPGSPLAVADHGLGSVAPHTASFVRQ